MIVDNTIIIAVGTWMVSSLLGIIIYLLNKWRGNEVKARILNDEKVALSFSFIAQKIEGVDKGILEIKNDVREVKSGLVNHEIRIVKIENK